MSRDSVPAEDYESFVADSDRFFDENFDHETDTHSAEDIVKILQSMDIVSESERDNIKANLMNSIPGESLGESDNEFYGYLLLNVIVFALFGEPNLLICIVRHRSKSNALLEVVLMNAIRYT